MSSPASAAASSPAVDSAAPRLVRLNLMVGLAYFAQAVLILVLAKPASLPVNVRYMAGPPGAGRYGGPAQLFDLRIDLAVAAFLLLAAADHLIVVSPRLRPWYLANVARGVNPARWWEYSVSASIMVVLIAMLAGVTDAVGLIALFGVNTAMILFGLRMITTLKRSQKRPPVPLRCGPTTQPTLTQGGPKNGVRSVYLVHFSEPYRHARHYAGWTVDLEARARERQLKRQGGASRRCPVCRAERERAR